jgi:hypothetical protein
MIIASVSLENPEGAIETMIRGLFFAIRLELGCKRKETFSNQRA